MCSRNLTITVTLILTLASMIICRHHHDYHKYKNHIPGNFYKFGCTGKYDISVYAKLDRLCTDCQDLFREPEIFTNCR